MYIKLIIFAGKKLISMKLFTKGSTYQINHQNELNFPLVQDIYLSDIFDFLRQWFDKSSFIEVNTSGSTGIPKTIRLPKKTMFNSARMTNAFFGLNSESISLLCLPATYIAGKMMIVRALAGNYNLIAVEPTANPFIHLNDFLNQLNQNHLKEEFDKFSENENQTIDFAAITPYQLLHSSEDIPKSGIKQIIVGGSPVTAAIEELTFNWPVALYETFGMTETASHVALRRFNGAHKSAYFTTLEGVELSLDERACLQIYAPHLHPEILITNDLIELKSKFEFKWLGRADRVINSGGVKIFPEQLEKKIQSVISNPFFLASQEDEVLGEKLILVIEDTKPGLKEMEELKINLKKILSKYEMPKSIHFISEFVYSSGNKILRNETLKLIN
jgi:O-succinylbenzoic acid--CoA ligase